MDYCRHQAPTWVLLVRERSIVHFKLQDMKTFAVFNATDGYFASPEVFNTVEEAQEFINEFPLRYAHQGYYLTSRHEKIDPADVVLRIEPVDVDEEDLEDDEDSADTNYDWGPDWPSLGPTGHGDICHSDADPGL